MRSFFIQIFLSFWVSSMAIFIAASVIFPRHDFAFYENVTGGLETALRDIARQRLADVNNCRASQQPTSLLLDAQGREVCGAAVSPQIAALAQRAQTSGKRESARSGNQWVVALPYAASDKRRYVIVFFTPFHQPPWWPHLPDLAIPVSALVTFVFAYLLTKPVRALRQAFRQFSAGNMSVRLPVSRSRLRDWGGADVRTLMIDFNDMAARIQALVEAHKVLVRDVSHELRSPLARLNVALELAREEADSPAAALDRAELESSRLNDLIGELLSLSVMESIQQVPQSQTVVLADLLENLMPDMCFEAESRGCQVTHRFRGNTAVVGSADLLRRAVENVIRNAIRYTPSGGVIEIETLREQNNGSSTVVCRISDQGPGVPEESLAAIFRPFYRIDAARQATTGGFGVGLAIADRAVHIHRGSIQARNRAKGGLCVELRFPAA